MCLALLALDAHPAYRIVIAANRDEYHQRAASAAHWWDEGWLAGCDLAAGGTWLGVARTGRWALLTNVREPARHNPDAPSRGALVTQLLAAADPTAATLPGLIATAAGFNGFNLLAGDAFHAQFASNRAEHVTTLGRGIFGLSNAGLDDPWPKVTRSKAALRAWCDAGDVGLAPLFTLLHDTTLAADDELPATGVSLEWERTLSAPFIVGERYGTRASTVVTIARDGEVRLVERSFDRAGIPVGDADHRFASA